MTASGKVLHRRRQRRQGGFSLLELLVAFVIMAFSLAALYQASGGTVRSLGNTGQQLRATILAQSIVNSRDAVPAAGWNESGESAGFTWRVASAPFATALDSPTTPALQQIRIVIGWTDGQGPRQLQLDTLLPQSRPVAGAPR